MKTEKIQSTPHKLGANRRDAAQKSRKRDPNFAQSRDLREDRGERQMKTVRVRRTFARPVGSKRAVRRGRV